MTKDEGKQPGQRTASSQPSGSKFMSTKRQDARKAEILSQNDSKSKDLYFKDGGQVYQLIGVLIHSGGAYGGHYYAFIRDFEDGEWYKFDDTRVTLTTIKEVLDVGFGGNSSGASAYMLFYEAVDETYVRPDNWLNIPEDLCVTCLSEIQVQQSSPDMTGFGDGNWPGEGPNGNLKLKIYHKTMVKDIEISQKAQLRELITLAKKEFGFEEEKDDNVRICFYTPFTDSVSGNFAGMEDRQLYYLGIVPTKYYIIERKADDEEFSLNDPNRIKFTCVMFKEGINSSENIPSESASVVAFSSSNFIQELEKKLRKTFNIPEEQYFYIFKKRNLGINNKQLDLLNCNEDMMKTLSDSKVYEQSQVLVEIPRVAVNRPESKDQFVEETSNWIDIIEKENHSINIKFNLPSLTPKSVVANYDQVIEVDNRIPFKAFKEMVCEQIEQDPDQIVMKRMGSIGKEIFEEKSTLLKLGLVAGTTIYLEYGTPRKSLTEIILKVLSVQKQDSELAHQYSLSPLMEVRVEQAWGASQVIEAIQAKHLAIHGVKLEAKSFRLRDKYNRSLTRVLREESIKSQACFDGKQIVLENVDPEVHVTVLQPRHYLVLVQVMNPETIELEELFEISVQRSDNLAVVAEQIAKKYSKIPQEHLAAACLAPGLLLNRLTGVNTLDYGRCE